MTLVVAVCYMESANGLSGKGLLPRMTRTVAQNRTSRDACPCGALVLSRFRENISWVAHVNPEIKVFVMDKVGNIGRESLGYLQFLVEHYENLESIAKCICFSQASIGGAQIKRGPNGIIPQPWEVVNSARLPLAMRSGPLQRHQPRIWFDSCGRISEPRAHIPPATNVASVPCLMAYADVLNIKLPKSAYAGGFVMVQSAAILSIPKHIFWYLIAEHMSKAPNACFTMTGTRAIKPAMPYVMERLWFALFDATAVQLRPERLFFNQTACSEYPYPVRPRDAEWRQAQGGEGGGGKGGRRMTRTVAQAPKPLASCGANPHDSIRCRTTVCQTFQDVIHATHALERPIECSTLPVGWIDLMNRQNRKLVRSVNGTFYLNPRRDFNVFMVQNGSLMVFNPREGFHLGLTYDEASQEVSFSGRQGELLQDLMLLAKRWPMPDALFWANTFDVPTPMTDGHGPTVARGGYHGKAVMPIPRWIGSKQSLDVETTNAQFEWFHKEEKVHWFGNRYPSLMPGDPAGPPFRVRFEFPRLAKLHPEFLVNRNYPYSEWGRFKYLLYLDGSGTSDRLMFQLSVNSAVFIPQPWVSRPWMADFLQPWVHFIPVSRNLTDLIDRVQWARLHDSEVRLIARRASGRMAHLFSERNRACATFEAIRTIAQDQNSLRISLRQTDGRSPVLCKLQDCMSNSSVRACDELYI